MMARAQPKLAVRPLLPTGARLGAEIFRASVEELTGDDYSKGQQQAWAATADDEEAFASRLGKQLTLLGTIDGSPVGFASLKGTGDLDMLYVHPAAIGQGIGRMLVDALEKLATARGAGKLTAEVSDNAQDFFRQRGFVAQTRNTVPRGDEWLANTTMEKKLAPKDGAK